jgi:hypothetical protein
MAIRTEPSTAVLAPPAVENLPALPGTFGRLILPPVLRLPPAQRLVVLVPTGLNDEATLAQHIWTLARTRSLSVLYVGRVARPQDEPSLRRRLALLAALTRDNDGVTADFRLSVGGDWLERVRASWRPGDLVVCHAEQRAAWGWTGQTLPQALANGLGTPVYTLTGFCAPEANELEQIGRRVLFWAGAAALTAGFFWLQINVQRLAQDWMQTLVLMGTVVVEFSLLAVWNRWLS